MSRRKISKRDREIDRRNALEGTEIWVRMPVRTRSGKRMRPSHGWGFSGRSPSTRKRIYKHKRNKGEN
ncbi:MAG: hypothetical protein QXR73_02965 [Candidatus Micrarchaeaceae archaeon]